MNVLLNCGAPVKRNLEEIWPHLPNLEWLHSTAAGVEHILFPALIDGPVTLTNAKAGSSAILHDLAQQEYMCIGDRAQEMCLQSPRSLGVDRRCTDLQGSFSHSLAEYTLAACNWFAKDFPRLRAQQKAKNWEPFNVEELRNKTMGVVGYGDIGQAAARIARAFGMKIIAMRRSEQLSDQEKREGLTVSPHMPDSLLWNSLLHLPLAADFL